jgi:oxalate decarboxylase/phosphoglucose isomerase-like protein (cupin superfamily)
VASLIRVPVHADERGILSVVDGILPFPVRRVYAIRGVPRGAVRGGHRHRRNRQALLCLAGRCEVTVRNRGGEEVFALASAAEALLLEAADWHRIANFSADAILLVLASEGYDPDDYEPEPEP